MYVYVHTTTELKTETALLYSIHRTVKTPTRLHLQDQMMTIEMEEDGAFSSGMSPSFTECLMDGCV